MDRTLPRVSLPTSPMYYKLRKDLHMCLASGRVIFFDLASGRYFCLPRKTDQAFQRLLQQGAAREQDDEIRGLLQRGILLESERATPLAAIEIARPVFSTPNATSVRPRVWLVALAFFAQMSAMLRLRLQPIRVIVRGIERRSEKRPGHADADALLAAEISAAFAKTDLIFHPRNRCLPRSLAFLSVCHAVGLAPSIVFGVRTNPFTAHCWIQRGDEVWHDDAHQAELFTPIFAAP